VAIVSLGTMLLVILHEQPRPLGGVCFFKSGLFLVFVLLKGFFLLSAGAGLVPIVWFFR